MKQVFHVKKLNVYYVAFQSSRNIIFSSRQVQCLSFLKYVSPYYASSSIIIYMTIGLLITIALFILFNLPYQMIKQQAYAKMIIISGVSSLYHGRFSTRSRRYFISRMRGNLVSRGRSDTHADNNISLAYHHYLPLMDASSHESTRIPFDYQAQYFH